MSVFYPTAGVFTERSWYKVLIKRGIIAVITAAVVLSGAGAWQNITKADEITVKYEGEAVEFDVPAQIINDTTMVPMRTLFELFGYKVKWDQEAQTVTARKNSKTITMTVGSTEITLTKSSGETETVTCSYAPVVVDGRTLIPLRAVSGRGLTLNGIRKQKRLPYRIIPRRTTRGRIIPQRSISMQERRPEAAFRLTAGPLRSRRAETIR